MYWLDGRRYIVKILICLFEGSLNVVIKHLDNFKLVL